MVGDICGFEFFGEAFKVGFQQELFVYMFVCGVCDWFTHTSALLLWTWMAGDNCYS